MKILNLLTKLQQDVPDISFRKGDAFYWSPRDKMINFPAISDKEINNEWGWALLHEVAHASLRHNSYSSDIELLLLESDAWDHAKKIGKRYDIKIDEDHIQDCLDTYRDWLHRRSTCPKCSVVSLQNSPKSYKCINCSTSWQVSASRFCRPYRLTKIDTKEKSPVLAKKQATFM